MGRDAASALAATDVPVAGRATLLRVDRARAVLRRADTLVLAADLALGAIHPNTLVIDTLNSARALRRRWAVTGRAASAGAQVHTLVLVGAGPTARGPAGAAPVCALAASRTEIGLRAAEALAIIAPGADGVAAAIDAATFTVVRTTPGATGRNADPVRRRQPTRPRVGRAAAFF